MIYSLLPLSQKDLRRKNYLFEHEVKPSQVKLNKKIVDRVRSIEAVKQVLEHYEKGHRSALINMATGTVYIKDLIPGVKKRSGKSC